MANNMSILVIDNSVDEAVRLIDLVEEAFPRAAVLPGREIVRTFGRWEDVLSYIQAASREGMTVLCLDVALDREDYADAVRGLERAGVIRAMRREWVLVAYTRFGARIASEPSYSDNFDGMIEKASLDGKDRKQRLSYVKSSIEASIRKKTKTEDSLPSDTTIVDSMGMRSVRAAFGDSAIAEIIRNEAMNWRDVRLEALTTGHSGAFMLSISGRNESGGHSLVLKVARNDSTVEQEIRAQQKYLAQLGALAGHLAVLDNESVRLSRDAGVYYRQARIDGVPLLERLRNRDAFRHDQILRRVVDLCLSVCADVKEGRGAYGVAGDFFRLSPIDIGRIETSVKFLSQFGTAMKSHGLWGIDDVDVTFIAKDLLKLARGWSQWSGLSPELISIVQHGDLNPGNIMLSKDGSPVLIDLARLGHWPVGYDLSRLSVMLRLRLVDWGDLRDWLHFGLRDWLSEETGALEAMDDDAEPICMESIYCDQRFGGFLLELPEDQRSIVRYGYGLGTLWDLLKVISYQDVSPYKRMWAMIEAWRLKRRLEKNLAELNR